MKNRITFAWNIDFKIYLLFIILIALCNASCEKMLEETPKLISEESFYKTAKDFEAATDAVYSPLRTNMFENYVAALECHSDWLYGRGSWTPLSEYRGLNDANINRVSGFWNGFFLAIRNANIVIKNASTGTVTPDQINQYVAEVKLLRAFSYLHLVRNWGGVPIRTELNMIDKDLEKGTVDDVYDLILEDLTFAEANLPEAHSFSGHPSRWTAKTLLADVYLDLKKFNEAATKSKEVIQSGKFALVKVGNKTDFQNKIFGPEILGSTEEIFALKYARLDGQGNYILWISNHPSTKLYAFGGAYAVHSDATNPNYVNWDSNDIRKALWDKINFGLGPNTLVSSKYVDPSAVSNIGAGNDQPIYRYSDILLIFAEADVRSKGVISSEALEALNKVRRRAYGYDPLTPSSVDFASANLNTSSFIDSVIRERGYEFQYEGKRWNELKRTGKVNDFIKYGKGKTVLEKHLLWPIPTSEMNYNDALDPKVDQNPGY